MPNKAQNRKGPAKSASSMIWLSILAMGLSTVRVCRDQTSAELGQACDPARYASTTAKCIPSSVCAGSLHQALPVREVHPHTPLYRTLPITLSLDLPALCPSAHSRLAVQEKHQSHSLLMKRSLAGSKRSTVVQRRMLEMASTARRQVVWNMRIGRS